MNFENHFASFTVSEILREEYTGRSFPDFYGIDISFAELETLVRNDRADWKGALESIKGIYLLTDTKTARRYVGSAYGTEGIWSCWCTYIATGHGGNVKLRSLINEPSRDYCRAHFRFALLEHRFSQLTDDVILKRETFWREGHSSYTRRGWAEPKLGGAAYSRLEREPSRSCAFALLRRAARFEAFPAEADF